MKQQPTMPVLNFPDRYYLDQVETDSGKVAM